MSPDSLNQQLDFILELDKLKAIQRKARIKCDDNRYENSAEHSWHIALTAQLLADYAEEPIDIQRVTTMLLIHDVVEIDAGDTFAFDNEGLAEQEEKEQIAADRLFGLLPAEQAKEYRTLWQEFEDAETTDGRFAKAIDRILPLLQNMRNNGGSWAEHTVSRAQVINRNQYLEGLAPKLWEFAVEQIDLATANGWLKG
ncbi:hydrolase [Endozoicomonas sp. OPT23]|uniref:HD domain-containing protein n=1 Tax=Endozoicomonas sp. OPT23 TaxID=2072845 RepID=UPI00129A8A2C|nr:HD domain-containing protein [Endozoicomonas sp. OPT23]MRI33030.1 hydrolase [Endozoicomonas sp. OPT23]